MLGLRNIARAAPRSAARVSAKAIRPQSFLLRPVAASASPSLVPRLAASFHISAIRRTDTDVKEELVTKLQSEIAVEEHMKEDEDLSTNIKEYLENSSFELHDKPGHQEVELTRTFGDEKIRVVFTTADLNNAPNDELPDSAMFDNGIIDGQSGGANTKGAINQGTTSDGNIRVAPEDRAVSADSEELEEDYDEDAQQQGFPARVNIHIVRQGKGGLVVDAVIQDGDFLIEDLWYFSNPEIANPDTVEKEYARRTLYTGPPFNNLDEDFQVLFERYLEERGINTRMAFFIPDYIDHKEQKEYIRWLNNIKKFVE